MISPAPRNSPSPPWPQVQTQVCSPNSSTIGHHAVCRIYSISGFSICRLNESSPKRDHVCTITLSSPMTPGRASLQMASSFTPASRGSCTVVAKLAHSSFARRLLWAVCILTGTNKPQTLHLTWLLESSVCLGVVGTRRSQMNHGNI